MTPYDRGKSGYLNNYSVGSSAWHQYREGEDAAYRARQASHKSTDGSPHPNDGRGGIAIILIAITVVLGIYVNWLLVGAILLLVLGWTVWFSFSHLRALTALLRGQPRNVLRSVRRFWLVTALVAGTAIGAYGLDGRHWQKLPHPKEQLLARTAAHRCTLDAYYRGGGLSRAIDHLRDGDSLPFCDYQVHLAMKARHIDYSPPSLAFLTDDLALFGGDLSATYRCSPTPTYNVQCTKKSLSPDQLAQLRQRAAAIAGPDHDQNGVRDDVDEMLQSARIGGTSKNAAYLFASALQAAITEPGKLKRASYLSIPMGLDATFRTANTCVKDFVPRTLIDQIIATTLNTDMRKLAMLQFSHLAMISPSIADCQAWVKN